MSDWINENLSMAHRHFHTKRCVFEWKFRNGAYTLPHKTLRVWIKICIWRIHTSTQNFACLNENLYMAHTHFHTKPCVFEWKFICGAYTLSHKTLRVWMKIYIWRVHTSTQNHACLNENLYMARTHFHTKPGVFTAPDTHSALYTYSLTRQI